MAAGRKPIAPKNDEQPVILEGEFATAMSVMRDDVKAMTQEESQHQARVRAVAAQIGYQLPGGCTDPDLIQRDIAINARRTAEAAQQLGLGLICLKEACQHGEFLARLDVLHIEKGVAQRFMQVARKFSNTATSRHLIQVIESQSKLLEMIVLDDEQLEELALTGELGELKLDDLPGMSVKELRTAIRELRAEKEANEKLLAHKSKQLDEAQLVKMAPPDEQLAALQAEAEKWLNDTKGAVKGRFAGAIEALAKHYIEHGGESIVVQMAAMVGQIQAELNALRDTYSIPDVMPSLIPDWVTDPNFDKAGA